MESVETRKKPKGNQTYTINILLYLARGIELAQVLGSLERFLGLYSIKSKKVIGGLWCFKLEVTHLGD